MHNFANLATNSKKSKWWIGKSVLTELVSLPLTTMRPLNPRIVCQKVALTALLVIETQAGNVSAYVPINVISITDG